MSIIPCNDALLVTFKAEIWNIDTVIKEYGPGPHTTDSISLGFQQMKEHTQVSVLSHDRFAENVKSSF